MTNDDLKRFYPQNSTPEKANDFVRYNANGEIPGIGSGEGGEHETVIIEAPIDSTNGNLTQTQLDTLQANDANVIMFNNEIYRLSDKRSSEGYIIYSHACQDNTDKFYIKCITITISSLAWVLTERNFGPKKYQHNINLSYGTDYSIDFNFVNNKSNSYLNISDLINDLFNIFGDNGLVPASGFYKENNNYRFVTSLYPNDTNGPVVLGVTGLLETINNTTVNDINVVSSITFNKNTVLTVFKSSTTTVNIKDIVFEL